MDVLINYVEILLQYIPISNHHVVHFKYLTILSVMTQENWGKKKKKTRFRYRLGHFPVV